MSATVDRERQQESPRLRPYIRDALDVARLALLVGAFVTFAIGPREQSIRLLLTFALVLLPRALNAPRAFDLAFVVAMSFQAWGNVFGAFDAVYGYDKVVHFLLPLSTSALAYYALIRLEVLPDFAEERRIHERAGIVLITGAFGLALGGGLYELYEWFGNHYLGAHLFVSYGDSIGDLTDDALGGIMGGCFVVLWEARGGRFDRVGRSGDPLAAAGEKVIERLAPDDDASDRRRHGRLPSLLVHEWRGPVRDVLDVLRLSFAVGLVIALAQGRWELGLRFALTLAAVFFVRSLHAPRLFDLAFIAAMGIQAWGAFAHAYAWLGEYGPFVHVVVSVAAEPILYVALIRMRLVPDLFRRNRLHQQAGILLTGFCFGFCAGIFYELYVFVAQRLLDAGFAVDYPTFIARLALDALGAVIGAVLLVSWDVAGWSTKRLPSELIRRNGARATG
jgi:uncharacterized membrane protein